jgi:hypothetical protein
MLPTSKALRTRAASVYLASLGVAASPSYLEKCRVRGAEDARDPGPDFDRDERGICWYRVEALDRYAGMRLAARQFRAPGRQPENFRRRAREAA